MTLSGWTVKKSNVQINQKKKPFSLIISISDPAFTPTSKSFLHTFFTYVFLRIIMDNSLKNDDFRENSSPFFFGQTSELNSCSNYEYFSDFFTY